MADVPLLETLLRFCPREPTCKVLYGTTIHHTTKHKCIQENCTIYAWSFRLELHLFSVLNWCCGESSPPPFEQMSRILFALTCTDTQSIGRCTHSKCCLLEKVSWVFPFAVFLLYLSLHLSMATIIQLCCNTISWISLLRVFSTFVPSLCYAVWAQQTTWIVVFEICYSCAAVQVLTWQQMPFLLSSALAPLGPCAWIQWVVATDEWLIHTTELDSWLESYPTLCVSGKSVYCKEGRWVTTAFVVNNTSDVEFN